MLRLAIQLLVLLQGSVDPTLVENLRHLAPHLDEKQAEDHAAAAIAASTPDIDPELLLAVAYVESSFNPEMTSRVENGHRKTGAWRSIEPAGAGRRFCGVLQTQAGTSWQACLVQRNLSAGYLTGAAELAWWLKYTRGDLRAALDGYGCGVAGARNGCHQGARNYARRVLWRRRLLGKDSVREQRPRVAS